MSMSVQSDCKHIIAPDIHGRHWVISVPHGCDLSVPSFTVAVVGNAQSLFDQSHGEDIDKHDVVIRINRAAQLMDISRDYDKSHGTRTDIWCMWRHREYENAGIVEPKNVCQMMWWEDKPLKHVHQIHTGWFSNAVEPWTPSTGLMILAWLYTLPCTVDAYGFDWKATPTYTDPEGHHDQKEVHNFEIERQVCQNFFAPSKRYSFWT